MKFCNTYRKKKKKPVYLWKTLANKFVSLKLYHNENHVSFFNTFTKLTTQLNCVISLLE